MTTIVIDAGHGGSRSEGSSTAVGAVGPTGLREKDVTLAIARRLAPRLGGAGVLTRSADQNLSLGRRIGIARGAGAGAFLSVHAGSARGRGGAEVWMHERGPAGCSALAKSIAGTLVRFGAGGGEVRRGALAVLSPEHHAPHTAACLVELDGLADAAGERRLRDPSALEALANALAQGLRAVDGGYGRGAVAQTLDTLDDKWPSRPAKLIPDENRSGEQIDYTTDVLEAIDAIFGLDAWDAVVSAGEKEIEEKLKDLLEEVEKISEKAAAFTIAVGGLLFAELAPLGAAYLGARKYHAKMASRTGFCTGIVWTADDRRPTAIQGYGGLWTYPGVNKLWDDALPRIALNCHRMGLIAGMVAGKQLTTTQKENLFSDLRVRDYKARDASGYPAPVNWEAWWENWDGNERPEDFYRGARILFEKHHLEPFDG